MTSIKVIDIESGDEKEIQANTRGNFPEIIYRNASTRKLDEKYKSSSLDKFSPISLGSCFTEGDSILHLFIKPAFAFGFYFGVPLVKISGSLQT